METGSRQLGLPRCRFLPLSLVPSPLCSTHHLPNFLSFLRFSFSPSCTSIFFHSCQLPSPIPASPRRTAFFTLLLLIQTDVFTSLNSFMSTLPLRCHISVSLSFHHSQRMSRHPFFSPIGSSIFVQQAFTFTNSNSNERP